LWDFRFSDPYKAISYDTLHSDDLGKWGKHLWDFLLTVLEDADAKGKVTKRCAMLVSLILKFVFFFALTTGYLEWQTVIVLLFTTMPLESPVPVSIALFAAGFQLERYSISSSFVDLLAVSGNPGHYGRGVGYWMRMKAR
jgi:hypothetical protein